MTDDSLFRRREESLFAPGPCARCSRSPALGFASIDGKWFCHGDYQPEPTCYMLGQRSTNGGDWSLLDERRMV